MNADYFKKDDKKIIFILLIGTVIGIVSITVLMLIFSFVMSTLQLDSSYAAPIATVCLAGGAFPAALFSAKKIGDKGYLIGIIVGTVFFVIVTIVSLLVNRGGLSLNTLFHFVIVLLSSFIGGVTGVNKGKNKKYI